jgi:hypothetical protein
MDARQELANNHGENFADEFDAEFDLDSDQDETTDVESQNDPVVDRPSIRRQLLTILSSTAVFYIVGVADGMLIALAIMRYIGG